MKTITLLTVVLCIACGSLGATPDFTRIYEILGVDYRVGESTWSPNREGSVAYYSYKTDMITVREPNPPIAYLLHELAHWTGVLPGRTPRPNMGVFIEEQIAEGVTVWLSEELYNGKYAHTVDDANWYLSHHSEYRDLTETEVSFIQVCISYTYDFLIRELRILDTKNELGLK